MPNSEIIALKLSLGRLTRNKSNTLSMFLTMLFSITFMFGTAYGTTFLQSSILLRDIDDVFTDLNLGVSLPNDEFRPNLYNLSVEAEKSPYTNKTVIKYHIKGYLGTGNLIHHLTVNTSQVLTSDFRFQGGERLDLVGYDSQNFLEYSNLLGLRFEKENPVQLKTNETIISHYLAQKLNVKINDTIYLHYINHPFSWALDQSLFNKSFPLIIKNIVYIPSKSNIAKDLLRNPFINNYEGVLDELVILESETLVYIMESLPGVYVKELLSRLIISIFFNRDQIITEYNQKKSPLLLNSIEKEIIQNFRENLPTGTVFFAENLLVKELDKNQADIKNLQSTLLAISVPIIILVFLITLFLRSILISHQIREYGILLCRGLGKREIRLSFLIEGTLIAGVASLASVVTCLIFVLALYNVIPNEMDILRWVTIYISQLPSFIVNATFLGLFLGVGINYFISRRIIKTTPIDAVQMQSSNMEQWYEDQQKSLSIVIIPLLFISLSFIILEIINLTDISGIFSGFIIVTKDIMSAALLFLPILLVLLLTLIVTKNRKIFSKYMQIFSYFINESGKEIMRYNYLRRPKHFSKLALITALAFGMGITPIMLSQSAQDVSIREIKRDIGSDIRISSTYEQMKNITPSLLYNLSSYIEESTPMIWIDGDIIAADYSYENNGSYRGYAFIYPAGIVAIQPENYVASTFFEDYFIPEAEPNWLFVQLSSESPTALAPIEFTNLEIDQSDYIHHDIGSVLPVQLDSTNGETLLINYTVAGFYYLIPGFTQQNFTPPKSLIVSIEYIESVMDIPPDSQMTWFIKINPEANQTIRTDLYHSITAEFKDFEVISLDKTLSSYLFTASGSIIILMDSFFFIILVLALFGLSLTFFQTYHERRTEVAIYRARGLSLRDIRNIFLVEMLSINSLGAFFGILLGLTSAFVYKDVLIRPWPIIPVTLFFPWSKIGGFLLILTVTYFISIFVQNYWNTRSRIIDYLHIRD
ncbi:MAG: FtsX-like permease family protein [Candidatus Thorarchaeota archaeon]